MAENGAKYKTLVAVVGSNMFSAEAPLTVTIDSVPPRILRVSGSDSFTAVTIVFSEPVIATTAGDKANYT
jgi:hypothetical protein